MAISSATTVCYENAMIPYFMFDWLFHRLASYDSTMHENSMTSDFKFDWPLILLTYFLG